MKYKLFAVMALLGHITAKSMTQRAEEEDDLATGAPKKFEVGHIEVPSELTNV